MGDQEQQQIVEIAENASLQRETESEGENHTFSIQSHHLAMIVPEADPYLLSAHQAQPKEKKYSLELRQMRSAFCPPYNQRIWHF